MKKFRFDADKAQEIQKALEGLENDTLQSMSADFISGGRWGCKNWSKHSKEVCCNQVASAPSTIGTATGAGN